jgi:hypothetical protein
VFNRGTKRAESPGVRCGISRGILPMWANFWAFVKVVRVVATLVVMVFGGRARWA